MARESIYDLLRGFQGLPPAYQSAARQVYEGAYAYAVAQGDDTPQTFADIALGTAITEGLNSGAHGPDSWGATGDPENGQYQSYGPLQLYAGARGGLGDLLNGDFSPANQLQVAFANMYGSGDSYNTGPWNGISRNFGAPNDSFAGQTIICSIVPDHYLFERQKIMVQILSFRMIRKTAARLHG